MTLTPLKPHGLSAQLAARDGAVWALSSGALLRWQDGQQTNMTPPAFASAGDGSQSGLLQDSEDRIVVGGVDTLYRWDGPSWRSWRPEAGVQAGGHVVPLLQDADGDLCFGTRGQGLMRWLGYGRWTSWIAGPGLPNDSVWRIVFDRQGQAWVGTSRGPARSVHGYAGAATRFDRAAGGLAQRPASADKLSQAADGTL